MSVHDYEKVEKRSVDEFLKERQESEAVFVSAPIEHFTVAQLKELTEKASGIGMTIIVKAEYSNFYQGVLVSLATNEDIKKYGVV